MLGGRVRAVCSPGHCLGDFAMCSDVGSLPDTQIWEEGTFWAVPTLISFGLPYKSREPDCVCASEG